MSAFDYDAFPFKSQAAKRKLVLLGLDHQSMYKESSQFLIDGKSLVGYVVWSVILIAATMKP